MRARPEAPGWFTEAIATTPESRRVKVEGCDIHYLRWGEAARPGLVLVHGGAAHAHWWSFIAPQLTHDFSVAALDLSGHGDSGRRESYPREIWAEEVMAVADDADFIGPPVLLPLLETTMSEVDRLVEIKKMATKLRKRELNLTAVIDRILDKTPQVEQMLLVVDQFEELYTSNLKTNRQRQFLDLLLA